MSRGGSRGAKKPTLRELMRGTLTPLDEARFRKAMDAPSDMVTAVVQAVELDYLIEGVIVAKLERQEAETVELLTRDNGPLGTFFAKIVLGYALGAYDADRMEHLHIVRRIRNAFAHSRRDISFGTVEVLSELASAKVPTNGDKETIGHIDLVRRLSVLADEAELPEEARDGLALAGRAAYVILCLTLGNELIKLHTQILKGAR